MRIMTAGPLISGEHCVLLFNGCFQNSRYFSKSQTINWHVDLYTDQYNVTFATNQWQILSIVYM